MTQKAHVMHGRDHLEWGADPIPGLVTSGSGSADYAAAIASTYGSDLVAYWKMEALSGNQPDYAANPLGDKPLLPGASPGTYHITPGALPSDQDDGAFRRGTHGFTANDARWAFSASAAFGVMFFVRVNSMGTTGQVPLVGTEKVQGAGPQVEGWGVQMYRSAVVGPRLMFTRANGTTADTIGPFSPATPDMTIGDWHHVVCGYGAGVMEIWVDGASVQSAASAVSQNGINVIQVLSGNWTTGTLNTLDCDIDEVIIVKRKPTGAEALSLYLTTQGTQDGMVPTADGSGGSTWAYPTIEVTY